jgi:zinc protease
MNNLTTINWNTLPGADDITLVELSNGITVLTRQNYNSPSVVISGYVPSGGVFDTDEKLGLAHFTAVSLMRGTEHHTFQQVYDALESVGASLGFGASIHNTSFAGRALAEDLPLLLRLLAEGLRKPIFPAEQIERLRTQILTSLAIRAQDTADRASLEFEKIVFKGHPYGRPEDGYTETIQKITREDLVNFHRFYFGPRQMVIVVVGAVTPAEAVDQVRAALEDWSNPEQPASPSLPKISPLGQTIRQHVHIPGKSQMNLIIGTQGPKRRTPDYLPASLGNNILGQFGLMGRIGDVVREQAGLAYYASTSLNAWIEAGSWEVSAGINPSNLQKAIDLIISELKRFVDEPVSIDELRDSQSNFIGRLPLSMESNSGVANALLNIQRFQLGLDYYRHYPEWVNAVTPEIILETARKYLDPEKLCIISAGTAQSETNHKND